MESKQKSKAGLVPLANNPGTSHPTHKEGCSSARATLNAQGESSLIEHVPCSNPFDRSNKLQRTPDQTRIRPAGAQKRPRANSDPGSPNSPEGKYPQPSSTEKVMYIISPESSDVAGTLDGGTLQIRDVTPKQNKKIRTTHESPEAKTSLKTLCNHLEMNICPQIELLGSLITKNTTVEIKNATRTLAKAAVAIHRMINDVRITRKVPEEDEDEEPSSEHLAATSQICTDHDIEIARLTAELAEARREVSVLRDQTRASSSLDPKERPLMLDRATHMATTEELEAEWIAKRLRKVTSLSEFTLLAKEKWPEAALTSTAIHSTAITADAEIRLALVSEKSANDIAIFNELVQQFPVPMELGSLGEGKTATLVSGGSLRLEGMEEKRPNPRILVVGKISNEYAPEDVLELTNRMFQAVKAAERSGLTGPIREFAVHHSREADEDTLRKFYEYILFESGIKVKICRPNRLGTRAKGGHGASATIIVSSEERSFADMLKKMKSSVDLKNVGVEVLNLRKTEGGEARLHIRQIREGGKENFIRAIEQNTELNAKVRSLQKGKKAVILRNLDETTTKEEITQALHGLDITDAIVSQPKRGVNGKWSAVVKLSNKDAAAVIARGRIGIGWFSCGDVSEMLIPRQCHRCFEAGHSANACPNEKMTGPRCYRCGNEGHQARKCTAGKQHCFLCKKDGHSANSMACSKYRGYVSDLRKQKESKAEQTQSPGTANDFPTTLKPPSERSLEMDSSTASTTTRQEEPPTADIPHTGDSLDGPWLTAKVGGKVGDGIPRTPK